MSELLNKAGSIAGKVARGAGIAVVGLGASIIRDGKNAVDKRMKEIEKYKAELKNKSDSSLQSEYRNAQGAKKVAIRNILKDRGYKYNEDTKRWH
ncbi:hypothetical protein [Macrococcus capreoli]|uniref:hypothetical protein n=1 Tax=Macrococcus capreoli TaxID=2982690 RepID=UPI0021D5C7CF|nr:hypothetical protein [Macrococcus sp. TMW 2.2395]MCU7557953.1 hypothetical protein [Macrococcus sp. TMW 2.2395]